MRKHMFQCVVCALTSCAQTSGDFEAASTSAGPGATQGADIALLVDDIAAWMGLKTAAAAT